MALTQQQINEAGEAFNEAMSAGKISVDLRGKLVQDLRNPTVGNAELINAARLVRQTAWSGYQSALDAYIGILTNNAQPSTPPPQPTTPAPQSQPPSSGAPIGAYKLPMRALTTQEIQGVVDALKRAGSAVASRVESELSQGKYSQQDSSLIDAVKLVLYSDSTSQSDKYALKPYLSAIDQRDLTTNALLSPNDPRVVPISGTASSTPSTSAPSTPSPTPPLNTDLNGLRAQLEQMGFVFASNGQLEAVRFISIGARGADQNSEPEGDFHAQIAASDGGFRSASGWRMTGRPVPNDTESNPKFPMIFDGTERDGVVYTDFVPAASTGDPSRRFKTLARYFAGFVRGAGPRKAVGRFVDYCVFEAGRGFRINVLRRGATTPDITTVFQADPDDTDNPAVVRVGNQLRRLIIGADGRPDFGEVVDESQ